MASGVARVYLVMESCFSLEAKAFSFSDESELRLEERRKAFVGNIFLGIHCSVWLKDTVKEAMKDPGKKDIVKSFCEEDVKVLIVRGGGNKVSRYLEAGAFAEGGRKGVIWQPEGRQGWGWYQVVAELQQLLEFHKAKDQLLIPEVSAPKGKQKGVVLSSDRSFSEVQCSAASIFFFFLLSRQLALMGRLWV